jgi:hypothetical protein
MSKIRVRAQGSAGDLLFDLGGRATCGNIDDGIGVEFSEESPCGFALDRKDLVALFEAMKVAGLLEKPNA